MTTTTEATWAIDRSGYLATWRVWVLVAVGVLLLFGFALAFRAAAPRASG